MRHVGLYAGGCAESQEVVEEGLILRDNQNVFSHDPAPVHTMCARWSKRPQARSGITLQGR